MQTLFYLTVSPTQPANTAQCSVVSASETGRQLSGEMGERIALYSSPHMTVISQIKTISGKLFPLILQFIIHKYNTYSSQYNIICTILNAIYLSIYN